MKAITRHTYGPPNVLRLTDLDQPVPKDQEILVRVHATTVNRTDCGILYGKPYLIRLFTGLLKPTDLVPGTDFAGQVEAIGRAVTAFKVGDRVWGLNDEGLSSQAQYMVIREDQAILPIPAQCSYQEVVACAEGAHYAYNFLNKVTIRPGDKVLVNGATGAIGSAALQFLKARDIYVTAVGNTKNLALLRSLGADKVIDYELKRFEHDDERYHFIFDAVGKSSFSVCKHLLYPAGVYISSELGPGAENLYLPLLTAMRGDKKVVFPIPTNPRRSLLAVKKLIEEEKFSAIIDRTYPMEHIQDAYRYVESGQKTGNVVITY